MTFPKPPKGFSLSSFLSLSPFQSPIGSPAFTYLILFPPIEAIPNPKSLTLSSTGCIPSLTFPRTLNINATGVLVTLFTIRGICPIAFENTDGTAVLRSVPLTFSPPPEKSLRDTFHIPFKSPFNDFERISAFAFTISPNTPGSIFPKLSPIPEVIPASPPPFSL